MLEEELRHPLGSARAHHPHADPGEVPGEDVRSVRGAVHEGPIHDHHRAREPRVLTDVRPSMVAQEAAHALVEDLPEPRHAPAVGEADPGRHGGRAKRRQPVIPAVGVHQAKQIGLGTCQRRG